MSAASASIGLEARTRVVAVGSFDADISLCDALARRSDVELIDFVPGGGDAAAGGFVAGADVILLRVEDSSLPTETLAGVRKSSDAPVILVAARPEPGLLEEALAAGVEDVLVLPQTAESLAFAVRKAVRGGRQAPALRAVEDPPDSGLIVTVFSPKGGTGKTVIATNLAVALAHHHDKSVLLVDLDLQFGDAAIMLGLEPTRTIHDLTGAPGHLDAEKLRGYVTSHGSGMHVLAAPVRPEEANLVSEERVIEILDVARSAYDVVVVDTSPFFYGALLAALEPTDELLLLCGLDVPTLKNVRLSAQTLEQIGFPGDRMRLVMNRVSPSVGVRAEEVEVVLGREISYRLPDDPAVPVAVNRGNAAVLGTGDSGFSAAVKDLAASLVPTTERVSGNAATGPGER
ncbi:MAG: CpaE family protein, partial [Gaiellales bacterium]